MMYDTAYEPDYADPVVRFQDPLFASSDREILVEKIEEAQNCALSARQECTSLQQQLSDLQAKYQRLRDKSTAKISELKSTVDRERSRRKQLTAEVLADKQQSAALSKHCSKLRKECLRTIAESEQRVEAMHSKYAYVIERYEQRLHSAAEKLVNNERASTRGHTYLTADIVDYTNEVQEDNRRLSSDIDVKQSEIDVMARRIMACGVGDPQNAEAFQLMLDRKDHIIELLRQQVRKFQQLSTLQYETLARIPHPPRQLGESLHNFDSCDVQGRMPPALRCDTYQTQQHDGTLESCTESDA